MEKYTISNTEIGLSSMVRVCYFSHNCEPFNLGGFFGIRIERISDGKKAGKVKIICSFSWLCTSVAYSNAEHAELDCLCVCMCVCECFFSFNGVMHDGVRRCVAL